MGRLDVATATGGEDGGTPDGGLEILFDAQPGPADSETQPGDGGGDLPDLTPFPEEDGGPPLADVPMPPLPDIPQPPRPDGGPFPTPDSGPIPTDGGPIPTDAGARDAAVPPADAGAGCTMDRDCLRPGSSGPRCDVATGRCVECVSDMQCFGGRVCVLATHTCHARCQNGQCAGNNVCDPQTGACVECVARADCDPGEQCDTATHSCVQCLADGDCALEPGATRCDLGDHTCVGCSSRVPCPAGQSCFEGTCVAAMRALCDPCDDDGQCGGPNDHCIGLINGGGFVDRTCAQDCTNAPCPNGFECISVRNNSARQCRPRYAMQNPTCEAVRHLGAPCVVSTTDVDPGCGITGLQDARCVSVMSGGNAGVCTVWCDRNEQCPRGTTCRGATSSDPGNCL